MVSGNFFLFERIKQSIVLIRGQKVMLDRDLANLYEVETRVLNQAVGRNIKRFPEDFMFALTRDEIMRISQIVTSSDITPNVAKVEDAVYPRPPRAKP